MSRDRTGFAARGRAMGVAILLALTLAACATSRSVVDIQPPVSRAAAGAGLARIGEVRDLRKFEIEPRDPAVPSLGDAAEISDPRITARALARKRNTFGKALGDVMLPEGSSVAALVRGAARKALQDAGYTVVDEKSPDYAKAPILAVDIEEFWAWITPGFSAITIEFNSLVALKGDALIGANGASAKGVANYAGQAVFESDWTKTIADGLDDLTDKMRARVRAPGAAAVDQPKPTAMAAPPPAAIVAPAARPSPAEVKPTPMPAVAMPAPAAEFRRTGELVNDIQGHWIGYGDYSLYQSPTPEQQQALLSRCSRFYSTFSVERSKFIVQSHQDSDVRRTEYPISRQRSATLVYNSGNGVRGARFTTVSFDKDRDVVKFGLPPEVLVLDLRSAGTQSLSANATIKYARCPSPEAVAGNSPTAAPVDPRAAAVPDARVAQADNSSSSTVAMAAPPPAPRTRTAGFGNAVEGRWINYADYARIASPTTEQQQALVSRCNKSYSTFSVQRSKLVVETHNDMDVGRNEYSISRQRPDSLILASNNTVRDSAGLTDVSFAKDRDLTKFGLSPEVLVFAPRTSYTPRNYARCPETPVQ
jgi:hypothetical protein